MLTSQKAEISIEFIVFIGILLTFFVFFVGIVGVKTRDINEASVLTDAQNIVNHISYEINIASRMEGYKREFYIPEKLVNGENYTVTIYKNLRLVKVEWRWRNVVSNLLTEQISGNISPGVNKIRNEGGLIIIES